MASLKLVQKKKRARWREAFLGFSAISGGGRDEQVAMINPTFRASFALWEV